MKARTIALLSVMVSGVVMAQVAPPSQTVAPAAKAAAVKSLGQLNAPGAAATPATKPNTTAPASKPSVMEVKRASPMKPKMAAAPKAKAESKPAAAMVKAAVAKTPSASMASKRDPFTSPIREQGALGPTCSVGKKCLAINAIQLRGIVKAQNGMIAVVESSTRRISYFLRENDPV